MQEEVASDLAKIGVSNGCYLFLSDRNLTLLIFYSRRRHEANIGNCITVIVNNTSWRDTAGMREKTPQ
jgi:hypothetical protein